MNLRHKSGRCYVLEMTCRVLECGIKVHVILLPLFVQIHTKKNLSHKLCSCKPPPKFSDEWGLDGVYSYMRYMFAVALALGIPSTLPIVGISTCTCPLSSGIYPQGIYRACLFTNHCIPPPPYQLRHMQELLYAPAICMPHPSLGISGVGLRHT